MEKEPVLKLARNALKAHFGLKPKPSHSLNEKRGVFVTLKKNGELRGCIGFPLPILPLGDAIIEAAHSAANDPRFLPLQESELNKIEIEVSVLTVPEPIEPLPENVRVGKDGLIIKKNGRSGLLLPQVATEHNMTSEEFLEAVCQKAGLSQNDWKTDCELKKFQAEIFKES